MSDGRTEREKAGSGLHWELLRQAHFTKLGNTRRVNCNNRGEYVRL